MLDDDELTLRLLKRQLEHRRYLCASFRQSAGLLAALDNGTTSPDLCVLDYFLESEKKTGLDVCRKIKARLRVPVIMLTANGNTETIVNCLSAGADQYVVKPYNVDELVARMEATLRLYEGNSADNRVTDRLPSGISFSWAERQLVGRDGTAVKLTEKEIALFELFMAAGDTYLGRERAFSAIYGVEMEPFNRSIDILVSRLRKKLMVIDKASDIMTVRGRGYLLVLPQG